MTDPSPPPAAEIRAELEKLALHQHMVIDGEYGCPGVTCPGVQKLITFAEAAFSLGAQTASEWQPIESAPKDGTWIVLRVSEYGHPVVGHWFIATDYRGWWTANTMPVTPVKWCSLPPAEAVQA